MSNVTERDWVAEVGAPAYGSIAEMVAALECDYERLEELRDERDGFSDTRTVNASASDCADCGAAPGEEHADDCAGGDHRVITWAEACEDDAEELKELEAAASCNGCECKSRDDADQHIQEDPLSIQVRSGWASLGEEMTAEEFEILLSTGGPAVRIVGELDQHGEPSSARLEVQDWFKPWTEYMPADADVLLSYARCFCFDSGR